MTVQPFIYVDGCVIIMDTHTCLGIRCIRGEWSGNTSRVPREDLPSRASHPSYHYYYRNITWLEVLTRTGTSRRKCEELLCQHIKSWRYEQKKRSKKGVHL